MVYDQMLLMAQGPESWHECRRRDMPDVMGWTDSTAKPRAVISAKWPLQVDALPTRSQFAALPTSAVHVLVYTWFAREGHSAAALHMNDAKFHRMDLFFVV